MRKMRILKRGIQKMKFVTVSSKELFDKKKNPTLCLSVLRALGLCHQCEKYKNMFSQNKEHNLKCNPQLKPDIKRLLHKRRRLTKKHLKVTEEIRRQIKELE